MKNRGKQVVVGVALAICLALILGIIKYLQISKAIKDHANFQPPPEAVNVIRVERRLWGTNVRASGDVVPVQGVTLANEVAGTVVSIGFESGTTVKAGALLIELNSAEETAELRGAEATRERAKANLARITSLAKQSASSRDDLEAAQSQLVISQAKVDAINAQIQKKRIVAPFDGMVGVRQINLGQYISPGTPIVSIHSIEKLRINFRLPQQFFNVVTAGQQIKVTLSSGPDMAGTFTGTSDSLQGDVVKAHHQVISAIITAKEPAIDPTNRNFLVQATVDSVPSEQTKIASVLRAGMFVDIEIELDDHRPVIVAPVSSIVHASYGDSVFVVERTPGVAAGVVKQQMVTLGYRRGEMVAIVAGLKGDEEIVSGGVFKLRPNSEILVSQEALPDSEIRVRLPDT